MQRDERRWIVMFQPLEKKLSQTPPTYRWEMSKLHVRLSSMLTLNLTYDFEFRAHRRVGYSHTQECVCGSRFEAQNAVYPHSLKKAINSLCLAFDPAIWQPWYFAGCGGRGWHKFHVDSMGFMIDTVIVLLWFCLLRFWTFPTDVH